MSLIFSEKPKEYRVCKCGHSWVIHFIMESRDHCKACDCKIYKATEVSREINSVELEACRDWYSKD